MLENRTISVIIPALNEADSIGRVIQAIPNWVDEIIVVDNGSTDATADIARSLGARVITEPRRGYGQACLTGIEHLRSPGVVVFLDGDFSDHPEEMIHLVNPILSGRADLVIGSRTLGQADKKALTIQARFGNWLACRLVNTIWNAYYTDLGPFRAIRYPALKRLCMKDRNYGWTIEMQIKAVRMGLRVLEVPVSYRKRIGRSKISGTLKGVIGAGTKILFTIIREALLPTKPTWNPSKKRIILFTRYPKPGTAKTRLIPFLGAEGAARLQQRMTALIVQKLREIRDETDIDIEIAYHGGNGRAVRRWLGPDLHFRKQTPGSLGEKMYHAFLQAFHEGCDRVLILGSDWPYVNPSILNDAWSALENHDLVLVPTRDGGYTLIGMKQPQKELFVSIPWGTEKVLDTTLDKAKSLGLKVALLKESEDVDVPSDVEKFHNFLQATPQAFIPERISIIIPTLNEASFIEKTIEHALNGRNIEVIVVDAGSTDDTMQRAEAMGARVVSYHPPRSAQLNEGIRQSRGEYLLFLHADTLLPRDYDEYIREVLSDPDVRLGAFRLGIHDKGWGFRCIELFTNLRSRVFGFPYGDQALFTRRFDMDRLGDFREIPIMEDFELVRRYRKWGKVVTHASSVLTSSRRWRSVGLVRTTIINQAIITGFHMGVHPVTLYRWYHRYRTRKSVHTDIPLTLINKRTRNPD